MNDPSLGLEEPTLSIIWPLAGMIIDPVCVTASHFMSAFNIPQRLDNVVFLSSIMNQGGVDEAMRGNTWSNSSASDCASATASEFEGKGSRRELQTNLQLPLLSPPPSVQLQHVWL